MISPIPRVARAGELVELERCVELAAVFVDQRQKGVRLRNLVKNKKEGGPRTSGSDNCIRQCRCETWWLVEKAQGRFPRFGYGSSVMYIQAYLCTPINVLNTRATGTIQHPREDAVQLRSHAGLSVRNHRSDGIRNHPAYRVPRTVYPHHSPMHTGPRLR